MPTFPAPDGTRLAYHRYGDGTPVVCLPGGPMQDSAYLGDLGGLPAAVQLLLLDLRGTGTSETPTDSHSYRCDGLVGDVEALREHLGFEQINLLGHSAGANLAVLYAEQHPDRVARLLLVTPSTYAVGLSATADIRRELVRRRAPEPWWAAASAAFESVAAGNGTEDDWVAIAPFSYGRWDAAAQAHYESGDGWRNEEAAVIFGSPGAYEPERTRTALAAFDSPVLIVAGELDIAAPPRVIADYAGLFPNATLVTQPGAGHFPWLDDPDQFATTIATFLQ